MTDIFYKKLQAFLHDPVDKAAVLFEERHEERARELASKLGVPIEQDKAFDHIASAMERAFLPKGASKEEELQVKFLKEGCIKHPFSAKELKELPQIDAKELRQRANDVFEDISSKSLDEKLDEKRLFFYLWRNLMPLLGKEFKFLPADTRIPDHSIFSHLKISSACYNTMSVDDLLLNNCSLFLFTIGPVQSFIAQARKLQDLYWASFILSYLSWIGAKYVVDRYGPDCVIFPELHSQPFVDMWLENEIKIEVKDSNSKMIATPTIPNRFMAILPKRDGLDEIGREIEDGVREEFRKIAEAVVNSFNLAKSSEFDQQIDSFLNIYWVAVPWFSDTEEKRDWEKTVEKLAPYFSTQELKSLLEAVKDSAEYRHNIGNVYSLLCSFVEASLGARKSLRDFEQLEEMGRKCSLCSERNALFYRDKNDRKYRFNNNAKKVPQNVPLRFMAEGEGLCAVCLTKRGAEKFFEEISEGFPSTATIALMDFIKKADQNKLRQYKELFEEYDDALIFEENLTDEYIKKYAKLKDGVSLEDVKKRNETLTENLNKCRYYAVIVADGDNMGRWLSGDKAPVFDEIYHPKVWENMDEDFKNNLSGRKRPMTPALHSALSSALRDYSLMFVKSVVEKHGLGKVVYSGGDDLLAFVNLKALLEVMRRLRACFSGHIDKYMNVQNSSTGFVEKDDDILLTLGHKATLSMGVCIAHYKTPLQEVLKWARAMEKSAKDAGKNMFGIALLKHSGEITETVFCWDEFWNEKSPISVLKELVSVFGKDELSDKFVYNFVNEFRPLVDEKKVLGLNDEAVRIELKRLISRACKIKDKETKAQKIKDIADKLYNVYLESKNFDNFCGFLDVATFLGRQIKNDDKNTSI